MKTQIRIAFAALLLAAMSLLPAFAQESVGTLQVNGTVMTSTGGEFVPAADGQAVTEGSRRSVLSAVLVSPLPHSLPGSAPT